MRIEFEDYYGNTIMRVDYPSSTMEFSYLIEQLANKFGYNVADEEEDELGRYWRVQQINLEYTDEDDKDTFIDMVQAFNKWIL